jgi:3-dehydroquinate dehydratase-2
METAATQEAENRNTMATILLLSGPNLNLLGEREPDVYGTDTLDDCVDAARAAAVAAGYELEHFQSNHEGDLIDQIHAARGRCVAIVVNPGAFTHSSYALADALAAFDGVMVELHLSNPSAREECRRKSVVAPYVTGTFSGFGRAGYRLAVEAAASKL